MPGIQGSSGLSVLYNPFRDVTPIDVALKSRAGIMNEVVVVGYGARKRATLTGSVSTVDSKTFQDRGPVSSPLAALQGQAPGVTVTRASGQPGRESWSFQVRGATSTNGTEPLVILWGSATSTEHQLKCSF